MNPSRKEDRPFSGTEVGAVLESLRGDISVMAERLNTVGEDVSILKEDVGQLKTDMIIVKDILRISIPQINTRLGALEAKVH